MAQWLRASKREQSSCLVPWDGSHGVADPAPHGGDLVGLGQHRVARLPATPSTGQALHMALLGYSISMEHLGNQRNSTLSPPHSSFPHKSGRSAAASPLKVIMVRRSLFLCLPLEPHDSPFCLPLHHWITWDKDPLVAGRKALSSAFTFLIFIYF